MNQPNKTLEGFAVEFYFDNESETRFLALREEMYRDGVTPFLGKMGDKPHISLAVFGCQDPAPILEQSRQFFSTIRQFPFRLSAVGTFPTRDNVIFLTPVPSEELLRVHTAFHQLLDEKGLKSSPYYHPGNWVPHCTIEFEITEDQLLKAISFLKRNFTPISGIFKQAGVVSFRPIEYLENYDLEGN